MNQIYLLHTEERRAATVKCSRRVHWKRRLNKLRKNVQTVTKAHIPKKCTKGHKNKTKHIHLQCHCCNHSSRVQNHCTTATFIIKHCLRHALPSQSRKYVYEWEGLRSACWKNRKTAMTQRTPTLQTDHTTQGHTDWRVLFNRPWIMFLPKIPGTSGTSHLVITVPNTSASCPKWQSFMIVTVLSY